MTDREYRRWIREIVVAPIRHEWGAAWPVLVPKVRTAIVRSHLLTIVHGWTDNDRGRTVTEAEIGRLIAATNAEFGDEIE